MAFELSKPSPKLPGLPAQRVPGAHLPHTEAALLQVIEMDARKPQRFGWLVVLIGFVGFFTWAAIAPLDKGAAISGTVVVSGNTKTVQHPFGGVIEAIHVKEGDRVKTGDLLMELNATRSSGDVGVLRTQWITLKSMEARLLAEMGKRPSIEFDPWFIEHQNDARVQTATTTQNQLFSSRKQALNSELSAFSQSEVALQNSLKDLQKSLGDKKSQVRYSAEQMQGLRQMAEQGYLANNRLLEAEKQNSAVTAQLSDDQANVARIVGQLGEIRMRKAQRQSEFIADTQSQLTDVQRQIEELNNRLRTAELDNTYQMVKSPVDGIVTGLQYFTVGGVVQPGGKLMDVVPLDQPLEIEGRLPVDVVDKVQTGLDVEIMFTAFNNRTTPHFPGRVSTVSPDRHVDERTGVPYYLVKVKVQDSKERAVAELALQPGMPAEMFIKNGERTLLSYLTKPLTDRLRFALNEE